MRPGGEVQTAAQELRDGRKLIVTTALADPTSARSILRTASRQQPVVRNDDRRLAALLVVAEHVDVRPSDHEVRVDR
jgi:hypothetical protein